MINYILLGTSFLVFILVLALIGYLSVCKRFEEKSRENSLSILIFGIVCFALIFLIDFIRYADIIFHAYIIKYIPAITSYIGYSNLLISLVLVPLVGICFFISSISSIK